MAGLVEPPLVGRDDELAAVRAALTGPGRTVVVTGPAGVGKSRLLRESLPALAATRRAMASPVAPVSFGVVRDLLAAGGVAGGSVPRSAPTVADRPVAIRAHVTALRGLPAPYVVVEDLHWADADSLAALVDLARAPDGPVLLATTREEPHRPLVDALAVLSSTPGVTVVGLRGLSTAGVAALVEAVWGRPVPARVAAEVRRRTDGLPYWIEELARSVDAPADLLDTALPPVASKALLDRVDAAGPAAARVAELASVLGERVDLELVARVAGVPVGSLLPALRSLVDAWIVAEVGPRRFAFRHALTREVVAGRVPEVQRRDWHARAYAQLAAAGAADLALVWHAAGAGLPAETVDAALRAATTLLAAGSGAEALRLAELALASLPEPPDNAPERETPWLAHSVAARAAYVAGYFDDAERHALAWRDSATGVSGEVADAECLRASVRWHAGDRPGQWTALDAALAVATGPADSADPAAPSPALARVLAARANALMRAERNDEAIAEADRALAAADQADVPAARRSALVDKGTALCALAASGPGSRQRAEGVALLAEAERASEAAGDRITLGRALNNALEPRLTGRTDAEKWAVYDATWTRANRLGLHPTLGKIVRQAVDLAESTGQWQRGWRAVIARLPEETDWVERVVLGAKAALLALEADRLDDAARLAERSTAEAVGMDQYWARLYVALVDVALTARTSPRAAIVRALGRYRAAVSPAEHAMRPHRAWSAALWTLDNGIPPATVRAFLAATLPAGLPAGLAAEAKLALAEAAGDDAHAVRAGAGLLGHDPDQDYDFGHDFGAVRRADLLTRLGRSLLRSGRAAEADEHAQEAGALLAAWPGLRLDAARALHAAVDDAGPPLTDRERDVRSLVAKGLSNKDIAGRLGVSPRTVAVHVSRLLAKTGCASRTELAVQAVQHPPSRGPGQ